jgi:hypothetical protein
MYTFIGPAVFVEVKVAIIDGLGKKNDIQTSNCIFSSLES